MTKQAPHVVALKAAFLRHFGLRANVRQAGGPARPCLIFSVPDLVKAGPADRVQLVEIGVWLQTQGYFQCHDYGRVGLLSSSSGWTCWEGDASVWIRRYAAAAPGAN